MKISRLFVFAMAVLSLAACSKDDIASPEGGDDSQGSGGLIDAISVSFVNGGVAGRASNAYADESEGVGSENSVYSAYVFAKEAQPEHSGALQGDWTVKEIVGAGGSPILSGNEGTSGTLGNMCSFSNVRQGENVYVIANDPNMTLELAQQLSRKGEDSEASIKAYVSALTKKYINGLTTRVGVEPAAKKFIMAGVATIPTNPNIANGSIVTVPIELDRELAKVKFSAVVTADPSYEAYGKVKINDGSQIDGTAVTADGIVVVRIPRQVSFFTQKDRDWYFPAVPTQYNKDWKMVAENKSDDNWLTVFKGDKQKNDDPATAGEPYFNDQMYPSSYIDAVKEYRLTWQIDATDPTSGLITLNKKDAAGTTEKGDVMEAPIFYTTPNYADNSGCATVICTQATYIGPDLLINNLSENKAYQGLARELVKAGAITTLTTDGTNTTTDIDAVKWTAANMKILLAYLKDAGTGDSNKTAVLAALRTVYSIPDETPNDDAKFVNLYTEVAQNATTDYGRLDDSSKADEAEKELLAYEKYMKLYYRADVAKYNGSGVSLKNTERNTYYQIQGTITSLGAKTIEEAITSTEIGMVVQVIVKNWTVVVNKINM